MDVYDVKMTDEDGSVPPTQKQNKKKTIMEERIWINRVVGEIVFQLFIQTPTTVHT